MGTYFVNALEWSIESFWASLAVGALCTNILVINNLRDVEQDAKAGKRTLGVIFGVTALKIEYTLLLMLAFSVLPLFFFHLEYNFWIFIPVISLPLSLKHAKKVWTETYKPNLNKVLEQTAQFMALYGVLFSIGIILG